MCPNWTTIAKINFWKRDWALGTKNYVSTQAHSLFFACFVPIIFSSSLHLSCSNFENFNPISFLFLILNNTSKALFEINVLF